MADSANPWSPKAIWAPIGALLGAAGLEVLLTIIDLVQSGSFEIPAPWDKVAVAAAGIIGAVVAAYRAKDGLRLPTLEPAAVNDLPNAELKLQDAALKLGDPLP